MKKVAIFGLLVGLFLYVAPLPLQAAEECFICHSSDGLKKSLEDGDVLSLYIDEQEFNASVHAPIGCVACHDQDPTENHPEEIVIESKKAYSIQRSQVCRDCHVDKFELKDDSIHPKVNNKKICTDCHGTHNIKQMKGSAQQDATLNMFLILGLISGFLVPIGHRAIGFIARRI